MDPNTYHDLFINLASNSPFLAWMIYSYLHTHKQLEKTREESKIERQQMHTEHRTDEANIRERYEKVITDLNQDRKAFVDGFSNRIDSLEHGQKKIFAILEPLKDQIQEIRMKEEIKKELASSQPKQFAKNGS